jgi:C4-dicarboxylate transporter DctM subunit
MIWSILALLVLLLLLGIPIGFALMITAAISMFFVSMDPVTLPVQMFFGVNSFTLLAIPLFILMGELMTSSTIASRLVNLAAAMVGWLRGGLPHAAVVAAMFISEMSGSGVADAAALSKIFVPEMEKKGYPRPFAAAVVSSSAALGIIIPPSIPAVIYGVTTDTSISDLFLAGFVPGVMLALALMMANYIFAVKGDYAVLQAFEIKKLGVAIMDALVPMVIPVVVLGGMIFGFFTPTEAAGIGCFVAFAFGVAARELTPRLLWNILITTAKQSSVVMMLVAGSAVLGQVFGNEQLPQAIAQELTALTSDKYVMLFLINVFLFMVGMFLHATAAIIIVPILFPIVTQLGIDPVHFGMIVCLNLSIGQQTPPVASIVLTVCAITGVKLQSLASWHFSTRSGTPSSKAWQSGSGCGCGGRAGSSILPMRHGSPSRARKAQARRRSSSMSGR